MLKLVDYEAEQARKDNAASIREFADRVESGEICDWVIAANDRESQVYTYRAGFSDRWRLIGAIESAKMKVWGS